ncbi:MAG: FAD-binding oxidoreductase [Chloroflexota bacterium]
MSNVFDILIIGGGVHGASLAFHLSARGVKVAVLEKSVVASGATGRSSGLVRMHYDLEQEAALAWESFQWFRDWKDRVGPDPCGFTRTGFVQIVEPEHEETLRHVIAMHQRIGIAAVQVTSADVKRIAPALYTDDFNIASYEPESGYADPVLTAAALMNAARARGAVLAQDCRVTGVTLHAGRVSGVATSRGDYAAPTVVNAAGAWAGEVCKMVGLDLPLSTWSHDVMFIARGDTPGLRLPHPTVIDFPNSMYFRPEGALTLVGLEDGNPLGESPDGDTDHARKGFVERAIERICKRIPAMENASLHSAHGGYDGITPDQHPALGPIGPEGYWVDTGFSGTGFKIGPATGLALSEWILDGKPKTVDITVFDPQRFAAGKHLVAEHPYKSMWR